MRFRPSFYGAEARILGMMHRRNRLYFSILKRIAKDMGGRVPDRFRALVMQHASDAADTMVKDEKSSLTRYN
jgi:hypothetical protein